MSPNSGRRGPQASNAGGVAPLSAARARVLEICQSSSEPLSTQEIVRRSEQASSTVQEHLQGLVEAGLVVRTKKPSPGRGRPSWLYAATPPVAGRDFAGALGMVETLAAGLGADPAGARTAREAGRTWGRRLRETMPGVSTEEAVTASMDSVGFAPERPDPGVWRLTRCPLLAAAHEHPQIICGAHQGVLEGVLGVDGVDGGEGVDESAPVRLRPFAEPGACVVEVPDLRTPRDAAQ